jgi:hypoxanthine phosphoribosyltransferase
MTPLKATIKNILTRNPRLFTTTKKVYRTIRPYKRTWDLVKFNELYGFSIDFARKLPNEFDVIVGVPRSGLIVANLLASTMGRPLTTPELLLKGEIWYSKDVERPDIKKILVVEDTVDVGRALQKAVAKIKAYDSKLELDFGKF